LPEPSSRGIIRARRRIRRNPYPKKLREFNQFFTTMLRDMFTDSFEPPIVDLRRKAKEAYQAIKKSLNSTETPKKKTKKKNY